MNTFFPLTALGFFQSAFCLSTVAFLAAWGAAACLRSPDARHRAWVLSFAVTGLWLVLSLLRWEVAVPILPASRPSLEASSSRIATASKARTFDHPGSTPLSSSPTPQTPAKAPPEPVFEETKTLHGWDVLPLVWAAGTCLALFSLILGEYQWRRLCRRCRLVEDDRILSIYNAVCQRMSLRTRPLLYISPDIPSPVLGSPLRPRLVLPADSATWTDDECECALHHELAHYQRRDLPTLLFVTAMTAILWFQPLAWMARRRLRQEAEMAVDDMVIASQGAPAAYAELLINLCRRWKERPIHAGLGVASSSLQLRLNRILDDRVDRKPFSRWKRGAAGAGILCAILLLALLKPVAANNAPALLQEIAKKNQTAFAKVEALSFVELDTILGEDSSRFQMEWWEMGKKCRYRYREFNDIGGINFGTSYSYDGSIARRTYFGGQGTGDVLNRSQKPRDFDDWLIYRTFITTPLDFVALAETGALRTNPPLLLIKDPANWQRFLEDAELLGSEIYQGRECVKVKVKNRYLRNSVGGEDRGDYVVYFDPVRDYRPAGWKAYKADGALFQELVVTKEETIRGDGDAEIVLPREIRTIYPAITWIAAFTDVKINSLTSFRFSLDETLAGHIFDEDTSKWSKAPVQPYLSIVLPDIEFTDLPIAEVVGLLGKKWVESNPGQDPTAISYMQGSEKVTRLSMKLSHPTVGDFLGEMQKQVKGLEYEALPKGLNIRTP